MFRESRGTATEKSDYLNFISGIKRTRRGPLARLTHRATRRAGIAGAILLFNETAAPRLPKAVPVFPGFVFAGCAPLCNDADVLSAGEWSLDEGHPGVRMTRSLSLVRGKGSSNVINDSGKLARGPVAR